MRKAEILEHWNNLEEGHDMRRGKMETWGKIKGCFYFKAPFDLSKRINQRSDSFLSLFLRTFPHQHLGVSRFCVYRLTYMHRVCRNSSIARMQE